MMRLLVLAIAASSCVFGVTTSEFALAQQNRSSVPIPPGTSVQINGGKITFTARQSVAGTYVCGCTGPGVGTCTVSQGDGFLYCSKATGDTCPTQCTLSTTSSGATRSPLGG